MTMVMKKRIALLLMLVLTLTGLCSCGGKGTYYTRVDNTKVAEQTSNAGQSLIAQI